MTSINIIVNLSLLNVRFPPQISVFLEKMMEIVSFDYTDFLEWTEYEDFETFMFETGLFDIDE